MIPESNALRVKERHEMRLLEIPGVQGVGLGEADSGEAIKVYVDTTTPGLRERIPKEIEGIPVVVEETGEFHALQ